MRVKMKNRSHLYDLNRTRPKHVYGCTKYKMSQYEDGYVQ